MEGRRAAGSRGAIEASAVRLYRGKLRRLSDDLGGQSEVARALDVDRSRVSRWLRSAEPDPENLAKLEALEFVVARLQQVFPPDVARKWLTGVNAHLGNRRPIDLVAANRIAEVVAAIEQDAEGAYA
jgi:transcriptional regulator with XRE-family HTH domain